jgi:hypothetical protein
VKNFYPLIDSSLAKRGNGDKSHMNNMKTKTNGKAKLTGQLFLRLESFQRCRKMNIVETS